MMQSYTKIYVKPFLISCWSYERDPDVYFLLTENRFHLNNMHHQS